MHDGCVSKLLAREQSLALLAADFEAAAGGSGRTVRVSGEAGIGKTSLLEHFVQGHAPEHVLWGACEALFTDCVPRQNRTVLKEKVPVS
jgi:predicted ATP-dependent serine protease